jgi:hypothetical protein|nr:hypothetical protein [Neorhizobium tomejilense]
MIFDDALTTQITRLAVPPAFLKKLNAVKYTAKRYVFDADASAKAGRFATECADLVCEHAEFAIPPFANTYVEIDQVAALEASSRGFVDEGTARRVGYLFLENGDLVVCSGDPDTPTFTPFVYRRRDGGAFPQGQSQIEARNFLMGEIAVGLRPAVETFSNRLTDIWDYRSLYDLPRHIQEHSEDECRGDLKRALATLLLLNQQHGVHNRAVGPKRVIRSGKAKTYLAHSVVTIDLSPHGTRGLFTVGNRASPRRHQVEGHFVHYGIEEGCTHDWSSFTTPELERRDHERLGRSLRRWKCERCSGLRVWREEFTRGDGAKGFVTKEYKVVDRG